LDENDGGDKSNRLLKLFFKNEGIKEFDLRFLWR
jgi:hypothetical protein